MLILALVAVLASGPAPAPPETVHVCSAMKIDVEGVLFEAASGANVGINTTLTPGACADVPTLAPGDYTLRFIEHAPDGQAALCARRLTVKSGDTVRISPDDGAQCIQ